MERKRIRRAAVAVALVAALALAAPAQASGWARWTPGPDVFQAAWQWITGLWGEGMEEEGRDSTKKHAGHDPDGVMSSGPIQTDDDLGPASDPDG
jgi:hypothetical protein